jgi:hypothetical protein
MEQTLGTTYVCWANKTQALSGPRRHKQAGYAFLDFSLLGPVPLPHLAVGINGSASDALNALDGHCFVV